MLLVTRSVRAGLLWLNYAWFPMLAIEMTLPLDTALGGWCPKASHEPRIILAKSGISTFPLPPYPPKAKMYAPPIFLIWINDTTYIVIWFRNLNFTLGSSFFFIPLSHLLEISAIYTWNDILFHSLCYILLWDPSYFSHGLLQWPYLVCLPLSLTSPVHPLHCSQFPLEKAN